MVFQSYALYPNMSVAQNMSFGLEMRRVPTAEREQRVQEIAKMLKIDHLLSRRPGQLSGGQRQRVAMGRALVRSPRLFLFDEPLSNLDAKLRVEMRTEIKKLHQTLGTTMIYVTHDQVEALTLATKIAVMKDGVLQQFGTADEIYNRPDNTFVAGFMGSPSMNMIACRAVVEDGRDLIVIEDSKSELLRLPVSKTDNISLPENLLLGIRPEAFTDSLDGASDLLFPVECHLDVVEPAGSDTFVVTTIAGSEITARLRGDYPMKAGSAVTLKIDASKISVFDPNTGLRLPVVTGTRI